MAKPNRKDESANLGEQTDMPEHNETDAMAGSEGIDDLAMEAGRQQGREPMDDASEFGGQGAQREGSPNPEGTGYTGNSGNMSGSSRGPANTKRSAKDRTSNDRDQDDSTTENSDSENPLA